MEMLPMYDGPIEASDEPCCGPPAGPPSSIHEKPGYILCHYVREFLSTLAGPVPVVETELSRMDWLGTLRVRLGIGRNDYKVAPGLYAAGKPGADAPVLVTANYKLSFDHLRKHLSDIDAWILVLDTRGINVWCAAGKGTFGTAEVIRQVQQTRLAQLVDHGKIILPQLGAPGVSALKVKRGSGFEVVWGPVRAEDLPAFLAAGQKADEGMRWVTFTTIERMVLVPVEISLARKPVLWALLAIFLLSGIGSGIFSFSAAWERSLIAATGCVAGIIAGCLLVPLLLPWIPGRAFAVKGTLAGVVFGLLAVAVWHSSPYLLFSSGAALVLFTTTVSSFLAMNFTGTTPFTSPSGVEKEMRKAIPLQIATIVLATGMWIGAAF
ncbi:MAG: mercury methylation corrinoid protein HgcA [Desulfobacteraceae bacterium]